MKNSWRPTLHTLIVVTLLLTVAFTLVYRPVAAESDASQAVQPALQAGWPEIPTNQIIIKYKFNANLRGDNAPAGANRMQDLSRAAGMALAYKRQMSGAAHVLRLPARLPEATVVVIARKLAALPEVEFAEPDRIMLPSLAPNDPSYSSQWHYFETYGINLPAAWDITTGVDGIKVAVIDSGITDHPDLAGRWVGGYDFITHLPTANDGDGRDSDPHDPGNWITSAEAASGFFAGCGVTNSTWHGTHVAGTIAATSNNDSGVAGINWVSKIVPVRALGKCGGFISDIADGMRWAAGLPVSGVPANLNPAKVLNLSLGGPGSCSSTYQNAINAINTTGSIIVVASGNNGSNLNFNSFQPANCNGVITVAATDRGGDKAIYSNFGTVVDISAPGGETFTDSPGPVPQNGVLSTLNAGLTSPGASTYGYAHGTSMAAPHVSGVLSLMVSLNPTLNLTQSLQILQSTARPFPANRGCNTSNCGRGIVNAAAALNAVTPLEAAIIGLVASNDSPTLLGSPTTLTATITSGTNLSYTWNFGDGVIGVGQVVGHTYPAPGVYTATVTATNSVSTVLATTTVSVVEGITGLAADNDSPTVLGSATTLSATVSSGSDAVFTWDFGDGASGAGQVISHSYAAPGPYTATVTATNAVDTDTATTLATVVEPITGLAASNDSPTPLGSTTTLNATVDTGSNVSYIWDFGDGASDTGQVASHIYATPGTYTATVTATNAVNSDTATTIIIVAEAITGLAADNNSPTALDSPTTLSATVSTGSNISYIWDFGDGASDTGQVVSHNYAADGVYTATVTASNAVGSDTATTIVIVAEAITGLAADSDSPTILGSATTLSATVSAGSDVSYVWDFGDGTSDTGQVVSHNYAADGVYTAAVTASNGVGSDTATTIVIVAEAITGLAIDNDSPTPLGSATSLSATVSTGSDVSYVWDFGDGASDTGQMVSHTYAAPGVYIAMVTAKNAVDADAVTTFVTVVEPITGLAANNDSPTPLGNVTTLSATVSAGSNISYIWDFGDGASGAGQVVSHTYAAPGAYTATVMAANTIDTDTATTLVTIDRAREAILRVNPSIVTMPGGTTEVVTITVTPGSALVNGVQIHGRVDPTYLRLLEVQPLLDTLPHVLDPASFDPVTGIFRYGAGILSGVITKPFAILVLEVEAVAATTITGAEVAFLFDFPPTDISGLSGSVLDEVQNGRIFITPAAALQATLNLQGRPADKSEPAWVIPLTVTLTEVGQETSRTFTPTTAQGRFTLPFIKPGLYDIQVKGHHTLRHRAENVEIKQGENAYFLGTLLEGDVEVATTFNQVVLSDFGLLSNSFNKCPSDPGFVAQANLNEHGCVTLVDFGLLSGNFNKQGDILNIAMPDPPASPLQARTGQALLAFNVAELAAEINQVVSITVEVEPRGEQVNGAMVHLGFDPDLIEIVAVQLADTLPVTLVEPVINHQQGMVQFGAGILGQSLNYKFTVATLFVRPKVASPGATITPLVDVFPPTEVSGPTGSVLGETRGVILKATASGAAEHPLFLPIIVR